MPEPLLIFPCAVAWDPRDPPLPTAFFRAWCLLPLEVAPARLRNRWDWRPRPYADGRLLLSRLLDLPLYTVDRLREELGSLPPRDYPFGVPVTLAVERDGSVTRVSADSPKPAVVTAPVRSVAARPDRGAGLLAP